ncbi:MULTISPECIES: Uma2 family endonuclease [unclassified Amycolatopsis]|uniref:Uma2 family endonuclease n=1 Tax=unclassified Amycolatopsis TaxID=2618356 RepID=UPI00287B79ED|nr:MULTISPECIES: Uma2 family endonuclease [unclassified Amycolatopsis]
MAGPSTKSSGEGPSRLGACFAGRHRAAPRRERADRTTTAADPRPGHSQFLLAAEIVSPSTKIQDRVLKRAIYAEALIPYYLLVEPGDPIAATLFELHGGEYEPIAKSDKTDLALTRPFTATIRLA